MNYDPDPLDTPNERAAKVAARGGPLSGSDRDYFRHALRQYTIHEPPGNDQALARDYLEHVVNKVDRIDPRLDPSEWEEE